MESSFPRPAPEFLKRTPETGVAIGAIILAVLGFLSGLEPMFVGEELSTLGDRLIHLRNSPSFIPPLSDLDLICLLVTFASAFRLSAAVGLLKDTFRSRALSKALLAPCLFVDLACFSLPLVVAVLAFDAYTLYRLTGQPFS